MKIMDTKENRELALKKTQEYALFDGVEYDGFWDGWDVYLAISTNERAKYIANSPFVVCVRNRVASIGETETNIPSWEEYYNLTQHSLNLVSQN